MSSSDSFLCLSAKHIFHLMQCVCKWEMFSRTGQSSKVCPVCWHTGHGFDASNPLGLALTFFTTAFSQLSTHDPKGLIPDGLSSWSSLVMGSSSTMLTFVALTFSLWDIGFESHRCLCVALQIGWRHCLGLALKFGLMQSLCNCSSVLTILCCENCICTSGSLDFLSLHVSCQNWVLQMEPLMKSLSSLLSLRVPLTSQS